MGYTWSDRAVKWLSDKVAADLAGKQGKALRFVNLSVPVSAWKTAAASSCDGVRTQYADVPLAGVTSDMFAQVVFWPNHIETWNLSPMVRTADGRIQIYAGNTPTSAMPIASVICWR